MSVISHVLLFYTAATLSNNYHDHDYHYYYHYYYNYYFS